jgi:hypothetical protein
MSGREKRRPVIARSKLTINHGPDIEGRNGLNAQFRVTGGTRKTQWTNRTAPPEPVAQVSSPAGGAKFRCHGTMSRESSHASGHPWLRLGTQITSNERLCCT